MIEFSEEIKEKINTLFVSKSKFKERLLKQEPEAIEELAKYCNSGFSANEILDYFSEGNLEQLQIEATRRQMAQSIYFSIIGKEVIIESNNKKRKF